MTESILEEINYKFICKCSNENKTLNNNKDQNAGREEDHTFEISR